jgi:hypothetical protein
VDKQAHIGGGAGSPFTGKLLPTPKRGGFKPRYLVAHANENTAPDAVFTARVGTTKVTPGWYLFIYDDGGHAAIYAGPCETAEDCFANVHSWHFLDTPYDRRYWWRALWWLVFYKRTNRASTSAIRNYEPRAWMKWVPEWVWGSDE